MIRLYKFAGAVALATALFVAPTASFAGVFIGIGISVNTAPPPLPVYVQPPCPQPDLIWTPGYWAYSDYGGYYWVPGAWVEAPQVGYLWTPGYWGYGGDAYAWHPGYWGNDVGFYGGVNYGYGYFGSGYYGGRWSGNHFRYNTAYVNVNRTVINNVYVNRTVVNNYNRSNRISYNGGPHGIAARPSARQVAYDAAPHVPATSFQRTHIENAARNHSYLASVNHGRPPEAAIDRATMPHASRPETFARPSYAQGAHAETVKTDPFSRFDRSPQAHGAYHPTTYHAAAYHAPAHHAQTYHAQTYHAPAYHAPAYHAPAYHAPAYRAPAYHAQTYHAPAYHAVHAQNVTHMNHAAPQQHEEVHRER